MNTEAIVMEILTWTRNALPQLIELFKHAGGRDAFLVAMDSAFEAAFAKAKADIEKKHRP